jgi:acyl transferase domain-containing protein/SAM-dependent methyltransferase
MSESISANPETLSPIKRALLEIRELRSRVAELERDAAADPIAITGIGLRFPGGARNAADFARLLWDGVDAITPIPSERWNVETLFDADPDAPGKMLTRWGGFLDDVDKFDAEFFGISPREAASMDPQQRLALEVAWEALEDAGQSPHALMGHRAGIYLGIANNDYGRALFAHPESIDVYFSAGNAYSVASGRLAYFLGTQGAAVSIDTACSSSLVALHLAAQALRSGECDLALAGGVNLILTPEMNINFSKARMMAPDGRCKTFDARADGYVRSEGAAFVVLERLSDAQQRGRRARALVRGSAINQDGRSNGLTAPNGPAQEAVIRAALANAGVGAAQVDYVEAHGTGTSLGDPIEAQALGAALGSARPAGQPLMIGSVKTNLGHLEAAAGVAGVVKAVLALERGEIPPHLNLETPSPLIDWSSLNVTVPTTATRWPRGTSPRLAGVSSFGFSGTNAHVILEEAPLPAPAARAERDARPVFLLPISARDDNSLESLAQKHLDARVHVEDIAAYCQTAGAGRAHFAHRVCIRGAHVAEFRAGLEALLAGREHPAVARGVAESKPRVAFLFTGQGPQHVGMARALYEGLLEFREAFDRCAAIADPLMPVPLSTVLYADRESRASIDDARIAQPVLFAVEYALAAVWRAWGIEPAAVVGHSFGEYVAACVAGVMSLDDALRAVVERTKLVHELAPEGAMAAIFADDASVAAAVATIGGDVAIAALNGPDHVVISGARASVERVCAQHEAAGVRVKRLHVSYGSHSPLMDSVLPAYEQFLSRVQFSEAATPLISNLTGKAEGRRVVGRAEYWRDHLRLPVRFADSIRTLEAEGITHFVEVGPHPVLLGIGAACVSRGYGTWIPSLHRDAEDWTTISTAVQMLYIGGATIDWAEFNGRTGATTARVPTYAFRAQRHWMDSLGIAPEASESSADRWARVERALERASAQGPLDLDPSSYAAAWESLARLTSAHAASLLRDAGLFSAPGEHHSLDEVMAATTIGPSYRHLIRRRLDALVTEGKLRVDGSDWTATTPLAEPPMASLWAQAEQHLSRNPELLAYLKHCGRLMPAVLTGRESPLETLFPGGSSELAIGLYQRSQTMRWVNGLAAAAIDAVGAAVSANQVLRVLEVGAGTGGTTSALLPVLPANRTHYHFTDVSDFFFAEAQSRFSAFPFVKYGRFDVDSELETQGYSPASFDVIVSANAVHASRDLRAAVSRLLTLLAPGGVLLLVESTTHFDWFDMSTGLIEGWQHFADDLRGDHPLLDVETWTRALCEAGFADVAAWPGASSAAATLGQHVIVARAPGNAAPVRLDVTAATPATLSPSRGRDDASGGETGPTLRERLVAAVPDERAELLRETVRDAVVRVLRLDPSHAPSRRARLMELGVDSLMAVQLRNLLGTALEIPGALPATLMFDHPTIDALADYLETRLDPPTARPPAVSDAAVSIPAAPVLGEAAVAAMSDADVERLLLERLGDPS